MPKPLLVLVCVLCDRKFSEEDVKNLSFFPLTSACFNCYRDLSKKPYSHTCFGKPNVIVDEKITRFGYDPIASEDCRTHCTHKSVCKLFHKKKIYTLRKFLLTPFDGAAADMFRRALKGLPKSKFDLSELSKRVQNQIMSGKKDGFRWVVSESKRVIRIYWLRRSK